MRLALAQIDPVVGDLDGNRELIVGRLEEAKARGRRPRPLPRARRHRLSARGPAAAAGLRAGRARRSLDEIARAATGITALVGVPVYDADLTTRARSAPTARSRAIYRKRFLPNYGVFDEDRYFAPGRGLVVLEVGGARVGITVCEDMWQPGPPATDLALAGARAAREHLRLAVPRRHASASARRCSGRGRATTSRFVAFCNTVGGQDELIFDGHSLVLDDEGEVLARAPGFEECLLVVDVDPSAVIGRRLRDVRRRALARELPEPPGGEPRCRSGPARAARGGEPP